MMMAIVAIVPAVLFGGFFMAESFINSESPVQVADATPVLEATGSTGAMEDNIASTMDENGNKHFSVELTESLSMSDSVEVDTP